MKRLALLLLLLLLLLSVALVGCEELGLSKRRPVVYPNASGSDGGAASEDEGGSPAGPAPTFTAQPGDIQI